MGKQGHKKIEWEPVAYWVCPACKRSQYDDYYSAENGEKIKCIECEEVYRFEK